MRSTIRRTYTQSFSWPAGRGHQVPSRANSVNARAISSSRLHDAPSASASSAKIFVVIPSRRAHSSTFFAPSRRNRSIDGTFFENTSAYSSVTALSHVSPRFVGVHTSPVSGSVIARQSCSGVVRI